MFAVLSITAPVFIVIGMGYVAARSGFFSRSQFEGMGKFVVRIGLPMLVFSAIAPNPIADVLKTDYLYGYAGASLLAFFAGWLVSIRRGQNKVLAVLNGLGTGMSNTGFIGYPLLQMTVGASAGVFFAMNVLIENILILPLMLVMVDLAAGSRAGIGATLRQIAKNLLKNPIIAALVLALVFAVGNIHVPVVLERLSTMLASAAPPLALFVIGGSLYGLQLRGSSGDIAFMAAGKLLLFPALVVACLWLFGADRNTLFAGALLASVPMGSVYAIFGQQYGFARETAVATLAVTVISFFSVSLVLLLGH